MNLSFPPGGYVIFSVIILYIWGYPDLQVGPWWSLWRASHRWQAAVGKVKPNERLMVLAQVHPLPPLENQHIGFSPLEVVSRAARCFKSIIPNSYNTHGYYQHHFAEEKTKSLFIVALLLGWNIRTVSLPHICQIYADQLSPWSSYYRSDSQTHAQRISWNTKCRAQEFWFSISSVGTENFTFLISSQVMLMLMDY